MFVNIEVFLNCQCFKCKNFLGGGEGGWGMVVEVGWEVKGDSGIIRFCQSFWPALVSLKFDKLIKQRKV